MYKVFWYLQVTRKRFVQQVQALQCCVCYVNGPSTEDMQHANRSSTGLPDTTFISDEKCVKPQDNFLDN